MLAHNAHRIVSLDRDVNDWVLWGHGVPFNLVTAPGDTKPIDANAEKDQRDRMILMAK